MNTFQQVSHPVQPRPDHDGRSRQDFCKSMRVFIQTGILPGVAPVCEQRTLERFQEDQCSAPKSRHELRRVLGEDNYFQMYAATNRITQELLWISVQNEIQNDLPRMRAEAERLRGSLGSCRTDPEMEVPRYVTAVDIHCMPGGYAPDLGDYGFAAGALYDRGAWLFSIGRGGPLGDDKGRAVCNYVRRNLPGFEPKTILDLGCTTGTSTLPYKEIFPDATVTGIDVAAPMIEYAHLRAVGMNADVNFEQRNAEDTGYPDESFDLVVSHILMHETSGKAMPRIFDECHRLLKPGGYMIHADVPAFSSSSAFAQCVLDYDTYYNNEPFWGAMREIDQRDLAIRAGFSEGEIESDTAPTAIGEFAQGYKGYTPENISAMTTRKTALGEFKVGWDILIARKS